jgi:transcriptional regulator with PAS, ATPase and Fis domain
VRGVDPKLLKWFCGYNWPGNVRELEHVLEYCFVFVKGPIITDQHLPPREDGSRYGKEFRWDETCPSPLLEGEKYVIVRALEMAGNNRSEAARILKISRGSLWRKMKRHGIE